MGVVVSTVLIGLILRVAVGLESGRAKPITTRGLHYELNRAPVGLEAGPLIAETSLS